MTYDRPITVQVQDLDTEEWTDALHLHAHVNKTGGGQLFDAGADQYQVRLTFDVRWCRQLEKIAYGVQPYRIVYHENTFKVTDYDDYQEQHMTARMVGELYVY